MTPSLVSPHIQNKLLAPLYLTCLHHPALAAPPHPTCPTPTPLFVSLTSQYPALPLAWLGQDSMQSWPTVEQYYMETNGHNLWGMEWSGSDLEKGVKVTNLWNLNNWSQVRFHANLAHSEKELHGERGWNRIWENVLCRSRCACQ